MNKSAVNTCVTLLSLGIGAVCIVFEEMTRKALSDFNAQFERAVVRIGENPRMDISDELVQAAIKKAVSLEADRAVRIASDKVIDDLKGDMRSKVSRAVNEEYDRQKAGVADKIRARVDSIDQEKLAHDVMCQVKHEILSDARSDVKSEVHDFEDELEDILKDAEKSAEKAVEKFERRLDHSAERAESGKTFAIML